jgi:hypothetical protein
MSKEEIEECCEDPKFCVVCLMNMHHEKVKDHICESCKEPAPPPERNPFSDDKKR